MTPSRFERNCQAIKLLSNSPSIKVIRAHLRESEDLCCCVADLAAGVLQGVVPLDQEDKIQLKSIASVLRTLEKSYWSKHIIPRAYLLRHPDAVQCLLRVVGPKC